MQGGQGAVEIEGRRLAAATLLLSRPGAAWRPAPSALRPPEPPFTHWPQGSPARSAASGYLQEPLKALSRHMPLVAAFSSLHCVAYVSRKLALIPHSREVEFDFGIQARPQCTVDIRSTMSREQSDGAST